MIDRRQFIGGLALGAGVGMLGGFEPALAAAAAPKLTGPVTGGKHGFPFTAYFGNLADLGYVEEEFFLEGVATRYAPGGELPEDGNWTVTPSGTAPYKTRMLVRRPRDPAHFNGIVLLEWLNVTAGFDTNTIGTISEGVYRQGFAYVMASCQKVGLDGFEANPHGLKAWDPERYGSLSIPGDSLSYDIFSQAAQVVGPKRRRKGVDPLHGLAVRKVIGTGASQSCGRLCSYINAIHPLAQVFHGYLPTIGFGMGMGFDDAGVTPGGSPARRLIRTRYRNVDVPIFSVNSETETLLMYPSRQPDTDRFRFWEVAGASHVPARWDRLQAKTRARDGIVTPPPTLGSEVLWQPTADAAMAHLVRWMDHGVEPPRVTPIDISGGEKPEVVRDQYGNARGGVRLPELEVPIAHYQTALAALNSTAGLRGTTTPFTPELLKQLYPTHQDYVDRVTAAAHAAEAAGVILPERVAEYVAEAQAAAV